METGVVRGARHIPLGLLPLLSVLAFVLVASGSPAAAPRAAQSAADPVKKVTLCHREGGPQYVRINVAVKAAINGHSKNHVLDIIPPFTYKDGKETKQFAGQNWTAEGQATWENGCVAVPAGEPIDVFVDCVVVNGDGSFSARYGYESQNTVERTVPIGAGNLMSPGDQNRGQPASFAPGVVQEAFTVTGVTSPLMWSVTFGGRTSSATATAASPACAQPPAGRPRISIFLACVTNNAGGTYDATFGYQSAGTAPVTIAAGADNRFTPAPEDRGQTTTFLPARVREAFTVKGIAAATALVWRLDSDRPRTATASSDQAAKCEQPPPPAEGIGIFVRCVQNNPDGSYDATFGYDNPNPQAVEIPVSEQNNRFSPIPRDRGQVTLFETGSVQEAFTVKGVARSLVLVWTLAFQGTRTATASALHPSKCGDAPPSIAQVGVFVQCVQNNDDGSYDATFGYESRELERLAIPIGERNAFGPAPADRGQPSQFQPGNVPAAFIVRSIDADVQLTWRLAPENGMVSEAIADAQDPRKCTSAPPGGGGGTVEKSADRRTADVGSVITYRIVARIRSRGFVRAFYLRDRLPRGLALVGTKGLTSRGIRRLLTGCSGDRAVTCRLVAVPPGVTLSFTVRARATQAGVVVNPGEVGGGGGSGAGGGSAGSGGGATGGGTSSKPSDTDRVTVTVRPRRAITPRFTG